MDTVKELVVLIKYSPKRETIFGDIKENIKEESCSKERVGGILKLCPTRWTVRAHTGELHVTFEIMGGLS